MSTRTSRAAKGVLTSFLQYGLQIVLQAALAPLVLKVAGQETLGAYSILLQVVGYVALLDLGFGVALSRFLNQAFGLREQGGRFVTVFSTARVFFICSNTVIAVIIGSLSFYIGDLFPMKPYLVEQARWALGVLAVWAILRTPFSLYANGLIATQNLAASNIISIVGNAGRLVLSLGLVYMGGDLIGLMLANVLSEAITYGMQYVYFRKLYPEMHFPWKVFDPPLLREMVGFGLQYLGVNLASRLFYNTDNIIVGYLYGAGAASVYYVTQMPAFLSLQLIWKISDNATPAANELYAQEKYSNFRRAYFKIMRYSLLCAIPLAVGLLAFNQQAIFLWVGGAQYAGDMMTASLAIFVVVQVVNHVNAMVVVASGEMRWWSTISLLCGFMNLGLSFWLGKLLGIQGVMVASVLADIPAMIYLFYRSLGIIGISCADIWREVFRDPLVASTPVAIFAIALRLGETTPSLTNIVCSVIGFLICWVIGGIKVGVSPSDRESILLYFKAKFAGFKA